MTKMTVVSADLDFDTNKALILLGLSSNFKVRDTRARASKKVKLSPTFKGRVRADEEVFFFSLLSKISSALLLFESLSLSNRHT